MYRPISTAIETNLTLALIEVLTSVMGISVKVPEIFSFSQTCPNVSPRLNTATLPD